MPARRYLLETSTIDGYQLEDGSGVLIREENDPPWTFFTIVLDAVNRSMSW